MEAKLDYPLEVVACALDNHVEEIPGVVVEEDHQEEEHASGETDLAETTDANFHASYDRDGSHAGDAPNDDDLIVDVVFDLAAESPQATVHLHGTNTKTGAHTEHGSNDGNYVDQISQDAVYLVTKQRVEAGAQCHGQSSVVCHVGQQETNNHVDDPSMDSPVEEGDVDCILGALIVRVPAIIIC